MNILNGIILIFSTIVSWNKMTCSDLRTGTFTDKTKIAIVKRTLLKQTEHYETPKVKLDYEFDIKWTADCEYILILTKTNRTKGIAIGDTCRVKINEMFDDRYSFDITYKRLTKKEVLNIVR